MKTSASWLLIVLGLFAGPCAFAQDAPPCSGAAAPVVVRDFTAVSQGGESRLAGSRLRSMRNTMKVDQNASALAQDIVKALQSRGVNACRAESQSALPASGWLVTGEFDESIPTGPGAALPSMTSSDTPPNTHVTVQLASLSESAGQASARIDTSDELKGQKSAAAPKPYGAAARFVINKVEGASALDDLAGKIADRIVTEQKRLGSEP